MLKTKSIKIDVGTRPYNLKDHYGKVLGKLRITRDKDNNISVFPIRVGSDIEVRIE